ncbi:ThiF family adenylyltransferase [Billgrantia sulfidoxydans]|uniref:ThiF family adenylyltransferase n=1 Tax=Billgrantia sulfidoxydans TaxID=2733484 RepID=A0ABX7W2S4_9GAMM|nr:ThiF family adenylyltransferase [Halomonas sulfidoxydans]QTP54681.1 ThiF family adenylyltransferase [Halomonas sulfidoxydans]
MMEPWWERYPHRLELEEKAFLEAGMRFHYDKEARGEGRLVMRVTTSHPLQPGEVELDVQFPRQYPYFPPTVTSEDLAFRRHQHPSANLLCLLANHGEEWRPASDTAASLIHQQLPKLARSATSSDFSDVAANEAHQGEPLTAFLDYENNSHVSVPPLEHDHDDTHGVLDLGVDHLLPFRGAVLRVANAKGDTVAEASDGLKNRYQRKKLQNLRGQWVRLANRPKSLDADQLIKEVKAEHPGLKHSWQTLPVQKNVAGPQVKRIDVLGLVFEDELSWRKYGYNWLIIISRRYDKPLPNGGYTVSTLVRSELESDNLYRERIPELVTLRHKKVAVFGLGSLGSVALTELARAGIGEIHALDGDLLEAGNSVRWATGRAYAGLAKAQALSEYLCEHYPHTRFYGYQVRIGAAPVRHIERDGDGGNFNEDEILQKMVGDADLILDASASIPLNQYLADMAAEQGIPYVWLSTTNGGWGGLVGRIVPEKTEGCWMCHLCGLNDQTIPLPMARPEDELVQPAGCMDPTFTGASFDIAEVSLMGVRLAVGTLCGNKDGTYPNPDWDLAIVDMRDEQGQHIPPQWRTYSLSAHHGCCGI